MLIFRSRQKSFEYQVDPKKDSGEACGYKIVNVSSKSKATLIKLFTSKHIFNHTKNICFNEYDEIRKHAYLNIKKNFAIKKRKKKFR